MSDKIAFTENEKLRFQTISSCLEKIITNKQAATTLDRSVRQIQRIKVAIRIFGMRGAIHGLKGKPSNYSK